MGGCWGGCKTLTKEQYVFVAQALTARGSLGLLFRLSALSEVKFPQIMDDAAQTVEWVNRILANTAAIRSFIFNGSFSRRPTGSDIEFK